MRQLKGLPNARSMWMNWYPLPLSPVFFTGNFLEAAVVSAIMVAGALVEEAVSDSARNAIESLVKMTPDTALLEKTAKK